jgi:hypothetical protein
LRTIRETSSASALLVLLTSREKVQAVLATVVEVKPDGSLIGATHYAAGNTSLGGR